MSIDDIKNLIDDLVDTNTTTFPVAKKVRLMNRNQDKIVNIILENDPLGVYDDANYTDLAEGTLDLTSGTQIYDISEDENFAELLFAVKVLIKDSSGNYKEIDRKGTLDPEFYRSFALTTTSGTPRYYRLTGKRLIFDIVPNYTQSGGIKIIFQRKPKAIDVADTTREVGIPTTFHQLLALMVSYDYARSKRMDIRNELLAEIIGEMERLSLHLQIQDRDVKTKLGVKRRFIK